jgi:hypothetical protein
MRRVAIFAILPLTTSLWVATASGYPARPDDSKYLAATDDPVMLKSLGDFARCVAKRDRAGVINFLSHGHYAAPLDPESRALIKRNTKRCADGSMRFNQVIFAGDIAEVMYTTEGFSFARHANELKENAPVRGGACVAARQPEAVDALFATSHTGEDQAVALRALSATVDICLPTISHRPSIVRAAVAAETFPVVAKYFKVAN